MKTWLWAVLVVAIGFGAGAIVAAGRLGVSAKMVVPEEESATSGVPSDTGRAKHVPEALPKVAVEAEVYDFGTMDASAEKEHDFVVRNKGKGPLRLEDAGTSCKCAVSNFAKKVVEPGDSTKITLKWHAREFFGPFEQWAKIRTNDPDRPEITLKVKGRVTTPLRAVPSEVVFSQVSAGQPATSAVRLWAYQSEHLRVTGSRPQDPATADFFEITPKPLSAEEIAEEKDTRSGYELEIVLKPGLPLGRFRQTILVETNLSEAPRIEVPIKGKVGSDISIVGRGWDEDRGCLRLGILKDKEEVDRTLLLLVRGRYRRGIEFEVAEVFPPAMARAELGERTSLGNGAVVRVPLAIHVSGQAGPANYLGSRQSPTGHVLLRTNHPLVPQMKIAIRFAVEGE